MHANLLKRSGATALLGVRKAKQAWLRCAVPPAALQGTDARQVASGAELPGQALLRRAGLGWPRDMLRGAPSGQVVVGHAVHALQLQLQLLGQHVQPLDDCGG